MPYACEQIGKLVCWTGRTGVWRKPEFFITPFMVRVSSLEKAFAVFTVFPSSSLTFLPWVSGSFALGISVDACFDFLGKLVLLWIRRVPTQRAWCAPCGYRRGGGTYTYCSSQADILCRVGFTAGGGAERRLGSCVALVSWPFESCALDYVLCLWLLGLCYALRCPSEKTPVSCSKSVFSKQRPTEACILLRTM